MVEENKYEIASRKREEYVNAVLNSSSNKKIVAAGPGTGKTNLFQRILEGKENTLTLTFVNSLVEDLSLELCGLSDVRTLHGFALSVMTKAMEKKGSEKNIKVFPKLSEVIKGDAKILLNKKIDFDYLFHNRDDDNINIEFYKNRKNYYGHYGFSDIVFAAVKHFEKNKDNIPIYEQVVVDEFQDFNALEVSLIDLLAEKSPILLTGDDDQALYEFKSASTKYIRQKYSETIPDYASFCLPYCSRCTRVIVEATNDIIAGATKSGYLCSRIKKPFQYFDEEEKDKDSNKNPKLIYMQLQAAQIPFYIQKHIKEIAKEVRGKFTVLIICPTNVQRRIIFDALKNKGFKRVHFAKRESKKKPTLLDGLKLLLKDGNCNLGWRIVAKKVLEDTNFEILLKEIDKDGTKSFSDLIGEDQKGEVKQMLKTLRAVRDGKQTEDETENKTEDKPEDETELSALLKKIGVDAYGMARDYLKDEIKSYGPPSLKMPIPLSNPGISKIPITITTIFRSKGLDADYVFITYFDDQYFIKDKDKSKITDQDICNFLVALTRARSKVFLISSNTKKKPVFLKWIDKKRIKEI